MIRPARQATASAAAADWQLVAAARLGEEAAVRELVRRMNPRLFRIARGILPSDADAEEVVQEAYLTAFSRLDGFRDEASFATWISRIAINAALMRARRARPETGYDTVNERHIPGAQVLAFPGTAEAAIARHEVRALLEEAVTRLPPELRLPFLLHEVEGQSIRAIARDLDLNPITVRTRLFRARRRLREMLTEKIKDGFAGIFPFAGTRCAGMADRVVAAVKGPA